MPSEIYDERTVSLMGWIDSARRSSMTPEHLIACAQLVQWFKFGLTKGSYTHKAMAKVKVSNIGSSTMVLSTPSLLDLLNDDSIVPQDTERVDETISIDPTTVPRVQHSAMRWAVADYVRLVSVSLAKLISLEKKDETSVHEVVETTQRTAAVPNEDWDVED
ncbi:hypothetical protein B0H17DRAFT_1217242 [Mycena rosella]|uniref:Uncharacterized protein n=1 Tax=Mycena rosella TaxID=1033263 RepID=A0AAD7C0P2_MYCRO|nr:hypothetical protein B0H17DRAFT_1217242 [Mycena rosella]